MVCSILVCKILRKLDAPFILAFRRISLVGTSLPSRPSLWLLILGLLCGQRHGGKEGDFSRIVSLITQQIVHHVAIASGVRQTKRTTKLLPQLWIH